MSNQLEQSAPWGQPETGLLSPEADEDSSVAEARKLLDRLSLPELFIAGRTLFYGDRDEVAPLDIAATGRLIKLPGTDNQETNQRIREQVILKPLKGGSIVVTYMWQIYDLGRQPMATTNHHSLGILYNPHAQKSADTPVLFGAKDRTASLHDPEYRHYSDVQEVSPFGQQLVKRKLIQAMLYAAYQDGSGAQALENVEHKQSA